MGMELSARKERDVLKANGRLIPSVIVPAPPSVNNLYCDVVINGKLRRVPSGEYKAWQAEVEKIVRTMTSPSSYPVCVRFDLLGKWNKQRDGSNTLKASEDVLVKNEVLAEDNLNHIVGETWRLVGGDGPPRIRLSFEDVSPSLFGA